MGKNKQTRRKESTDDESSRGRTSISIEGEQAADPPLRLSSATAPSRRGRRKAPRETQERTASSPLGTHGSDTSREQLEYELQATREDLQSTIEALESSNEELKDLNETLEQRVQERAGLIRVLHDITVACHRAGTVEEALVYVLREFSRYSGWCFGHAFRPAGNHVNELVSFMDFHEDTPERFERFREETAKRRLKSGEGVPGRAWARGKPVFVADLGAESEAAPCRDHALAAGIKTAAAFPVLVGDQVVAVLEFFSDARLELDDQTLEAMASIGSQLSRVVERTRLQREVADVATDEQQRLGSHLHDSVIQHLTGSEMMAESLRQKIADTPHEADAATLVEAIRETQRQTRRLHRGLMPVEVDAAGLMAALENLASLTSEMHNVECVFERDKIVLLEDSITATHLYRIAQEAVYNAVKHAQPQRITISLTDGKQIQLTIQDDGRGIRGDSKKIAGSGMRIMRYRAELIGCRLTVESKEGDGTRVKVRETP